VHDAPAARLEVRDAPTVAFPCQPLAVPLVAVAFERQHPPKPNEVDAVVPDGMLRDIGYQVVSAKQNGRFDFELRLLRSFADDVQELAKRGRNPGDRARRVDSPRARRPAR
jgi:hypothetical protein